MSKLEIPEVVYHYTSNDVLLKILEHKALRLSAKHHLNDTLEGDQFFALLKTHPSAPDSLRIDDLRNALDPFEFFVTCFSSLGDRLSQWRGYAANGTGVSIGFKSKAILTAIKGVKRLFFIRLPMPIRWTNCRMIGPTQSMQCSRARDRQALPLFRRLRKSAGQSNPQGSRKSMKLGWLSLLTREAENFTQ
ncbi:DUF2971 domain-containing protein [Melaminivora jejuensis]|uniref:DUF2971 domain-containing protein n=1 Tax=Melaminivora jejuensis TaxID=1267217 RepID=UPI001AE02606|nr:DUF2971 domain-containing protein [Melaminivora jejuensis]